MKPIPSQEIGISRRCDLADGCRPPHPRRPGDLLPMVGSGENEMSNTRAWRSKQRTSKPNARQKRNGLFLDAHRTCQSCKKRRSREAHHDLPKGHPSRYDWQYMRALCVPCHVTVHQHLKGIFTVRQRTV